MDMWGFGGAVVRHSCRHSPFTSEVAGSIFSESVLNVILLEPSGPPM